jgi:deoxyribonuclease IV
VRIGAHVPTRGGLASVVRHAIDRGAEAIQFFASNPRAWAPPRVDPAAAEEFREACAEAGVGPVFLHAPYLVNVASPVPEFHRKSVDLARATMIAAEEIGAAGLVVHSGSGGRGERDTARHRAVAALEAIAAVAEDAFVVVELMAGGSGTVASTFGEAAELFEAVERSGRLRLCVDTCHLFAAGYAVDDPRGVRRCFGEMRRAGLAGRLVLVHANDAKHPRGSRRDAHENVGHGHIGRTGFAAVLSDRAVRRCAVLCETPGRLEDHRRDVAMLRELAG